MNYSDLTFYDFYTTSLEVEKIKIKIIFGLTCDGVRRYFITNCFFLPDIGPEPIDLIEVEDEDGSVILEGEVEDSEEIMKVIVKSYHYSKKLEELKE